jgi:signal transduction histidine kinase/ActR/RegA family two-component response regulator
MPSSPSTRDASARSVPLRRRLFVLAAAAIVPLAVMAAVGLAALISEERMQATRTGLELARALATAVDAELRRSVSVLELLAGAPVLDRGNIAEFNPLVQRALATRPYWMAVNLAEPGGRQLMNTQYTSGDPLPPLVDRESFDRLVHDGMPSVGALAKGPLGRLGFTVRVPVMREGQLRYVLSAVVKPDAIFDVVRRQRLPADWVVSVFDAKTQRVARSREHEAYLGQPPSASLAKLMQAKGDEGAGVTYSMENERIYSAYTRLPASGWSVAIGIPPSFVESGIRQSLLAFGGGIVLSIVLGFVLALHFARTINRPIAELRAGAQSLGRGGEPQRPRTDIQEIHDVGEALLAASRELAAGAAERADLLHREQKARAIAEGASRAKDEFLAMLGHELRNPLGAIANAVRLLEHPRSDADTALNARAIIARQAEHLARMTDDLLDAGRALTGKIALHRRPVDLAAAASAALAALRSRTERHRVVQRLESAWVDADPIRLEQILSNLVVNATKYTPAGGTIRVSVRREGADAVLRVADDGAGMTPQLIEQAFELFVQGTSDLDRAHGGLGIGLTLVRRLAELHGGRAHAASAGPGQGSEFTVRLPGIAAPQPASAPGRTGERGPSRDILIIEDNADARETLRRLLELGGHTVRTAPDGAAGLEVMLAAPPEVALVDIGLPKLDGYELARRFRQAGGQGRRSLLVALSGYGLPEDAQRALEAGFDAHLVKPIDEQALEALLAKRPSASQAPQ